MRKSGHEMQYELRRGRYVISTARERLDLGLVHEFISRSYWGQGRTLEMVQRANERSMPFGLYLEEANGTWRQIGYARVVTDFTVFAFLLDVFVTEEHRNRGLGHWLMEVILGHPELDGVQGWLLGTRDAHRLYEKVGFRPAEPGRYMTRRQPPPRPPEEP
jgi:GNAT superfamily N-acetyltransferase